MLVSLVVYIASITNNKVVNKEYLQKFANNLKKKRKELGLTQDDLSNEHISRAMISLVEIARTDITVSKLKVIADIMGLKVKDLFDFEWF